MAARRSISSCERRRGLSAKQSRDHFLGGAIEKRLDQMTQGGPADQMKRERGSVNITQAVLIVPDVAFFLEDAELGAHGRVMRFSGETREDISDSRAFEFVENVHNLAFTAREGVWFGFFHDLLFPSIKC